MRTVHVNAQSADGTKQKLLPEQRLQVHHLIPKGRGGNFGNISRLGSQDNVRVSRGKF